MVEFAAIVPLLFLLVLGTFEAGRFIFHYELLNNAAREGAREAIVFRQNCNAATVLSNVDTRVTAYLAAANIDTADVTISTTGACSGSGNDVTVSVDYAHPLQVIQAFSGGFFGGTIDADINLPGRSTMRNE